MSLPDAVRGLSAEDVLPAVIPPQPRTVAKHSRGAGIADGSGGGSGVGSVKVSDPATRLHYARVVAALAYVATGGLDHAHNLVGGPSISVPPHFLIQTS